MKIRGTVLFAFLAVTSSVAQQPQTITDGEGTKLTFTIDGITAVSTDGTARHLPADWLNQNCSAPSQTGLKDANDLAALKAICEDWIQFNQQKGDGASILEPPSALPDDCPMSRVLSVSLHGQSEAYKLLAYQIAALDAGHNAQASDAFALKSMKSDTADPTGMLTDVFRNFDIATHKFRCAAFIEGQYQADGQEREIARTTLVSAYNRLAILNDRMKAYVEGRFRGSADPNADTTLDNAKKLATLTDDRNGAVSDVMNAAQMGALLSLYTGDHSASVADTLDMSAGEREQLLSELNQILKSGPPDDFTQNAGVLKDFLMHHPKVRK